MKKTIFGSLAGLPVLLNHSLFTFLFFTISLISGAQCLSTSTVSGTTFSNDNSIGTLAFSTTSNAVTSDDSRATATALVNLFTGSSNYLKVTGFGFNIPSYASICGVTVDIEKRASGLAVLAWVRDNEVRLVKANTIAGSNLGNTGADWGTTDAYSTHGDANHLWGTTLTPADVNAADFGVAISAGFNGLVDVFPSAQIDHIRMTIHYNPVLPVKLISFNSRLKDNIAHLEWVTADEEDGELVTLQRSITGQFQWADLFRFEMHTSNTTKKYNYSDPLNKTGNYSYRLKITNKNQQSNYSAIKNIVYEDKNSPFTAYPNPTRDFLIINNVKDVQGIFVRNLCMQLLKVPVQVIGEYSVRIDVLQLPKGIYFITTANHTMKFIKE